MLDRSCPDCHSDDFRFRQAYLTKHNSSRTLFMCRSRKKSFSETRRDVRIKEKGNQECLSGVSSKSRSAQAMENKGMLP